MERFNRLQDGLTDNDEEIRNSGDYVFRRTDDGTWWYSLGDTSRYENYGPYANREEAIAAHEHNDDNYAVAVMVDTDGSFHIVERFHAASDEEANAYAEQHHGDIEWYVLDADGDNING